MSKGRPGENGKSKAWRQRRQYRKWRHLKAMARSVAASGGGASARNRRREMAAHGCARRRNQRGWRRNGGVAALAACVNLAASAIISRMA
jgi:hypothetical protein